MTGWVAIASSEDVTATPRSVLVAGRPWTAVRFRPDGPATLLASHCPHRLVPLVAATVTADGLRCPYHGWEFDSSGACILIPSLGPDARLPPRASLPAAPRLRERYGRVEALVEPAAIPPAVAGLSNEDPRLRAAWHPVALSSELGPEPHPVLLLGDAWSVSRSGGQLISDPPAHAVIERWGLVWLAPEKPRVPLFDEPDEEDAAYVGAWLTPERTTAPAGFVANNFLDVAHFPFVHAETFGAGEATFVEPYDVDLEPGGFRSMQVQDFDNPQDPEVVAGRRPMRQRRRATYVYRAPFQLLLRLEELDAGAVKTILFCVQPESLTSTRIYTKMLLHGIGGVARPGPEVVAAEVSYEARVFAEDLALQEQLDVRVLPLDTRSELHVRADRLGVALRRQLSALVNVSSGT